MEHAKLLHFMAELAMNPEKLEEYHKDPDAAMEEAGLSAEHKDAINNQDKEKIKDFMNSFTAPMFTSGSRILSPVAGSRILSPTEEEN
jgi:hypothetical protein